MASEEEVQAYIEEKKTLAYGPPEVRLAKNKAYVAELVEAHSEKFIRNLLKAMEKASEPVRNRRKRRSRKIDFDTVPLEQVLRRYDLPWCYFERVVILEGMVRADLTHGVWMAAQGETYLFEIKGEELNLIDHCLEWLS